MNLDQVLDLTDLLKGMKCRPRRPFLVVLKPVRDELIERFLLTNAAKHRLFVLEYRVRPGCFSIDE